MKKKDEIVHAPNSGVALRDPYEQRALHLLPKEQRYLAELSRRPESSGADMKKELLAAAHKLGISELPTDEELSQMLRFLRRFHPGLGKEDLAEAFDLGMAGVLPIEMKEVNAFGSFSLFYVTRIVHAYEKLRNKADLALRHKAEELRIEDDRENKNAEYDKFGAAGDMWHFEMMTLLKDEKKYINTAMHIYTGSATYRLLRSIGVITDDIAQCLARDVYASDGMSHENANDKVKRDMFISFCNRSMLFPFEANKDRNIDRIAKIIAAQKRASATGEYWTKYPVFSSYIKKAFGIILLIDETKADIPPKKGKNKK